MKNKNKGTEDMPRPQYMKYENRYKITPLFMNDLKIVLGEIAYVEVKPVIDYITSRDNILYASCLNELINKIANFPYKYVNSIMNVIQNKELVGKYFEEVEEKKN